MFMQRRETWHIIYRKIHSAPFNPNELWKKATDQTETHNLIHPYRIATLNFRSNLIEFFVTHK